MTVKEEVFNSIVLKGEITGEIKVSHKVFGEDFMSMDLDVMRSSGKTDRLPVIVPGRLIIDKKLSPGNNVRVEGQIRTYNRVIDNKNRLLIVVFAEEIECTDEEEYGFDENYVFIEGFLCKKPFYRISPKGREITDIMLAVNRSFGKSDYIPCIIWGRNARFAGKLDVGTRIRISGRMQSREYRKRIDINNYYTGVAREVSTQKIEVIREDKTEKPDIMSGLYIIP